MLVSVILRKKGVGVSRGYLPQQSKTSVSISHVGKRNSMHRRGNCGISMGFLVALAMRT